MISRPTLPTDLIADAFDRAFEQIHSLTLDMGKQIASDIQNAFWGRIRRHRVRSFIRALLCSTAIIPAAWIRWSIR